VDIFSIYVPKNRAKSLSLAGALILVIALADWATKPYLSLGFLYLFPIVLAVGFLARTQIFLLSLFCAVLHEAFSSLPSPDIVRTATVTVAFAGTGLFISELVKNRHLVDSHIHQLEEQIRFRRDAEEQLEMLIETNPAAIIIMDSKGAILASNGAARELLAPDNNTLVGMSVRPYLPDLHAAAGNHNLSALRTMMQCKGQRENGEAFFAACWFSTYKTVTGSKLAAIVVDLSEELRDREQLSLNHLLKNTRLLVAAVCHEIRNLCGAVSVVQKNLSHVEGLLENQDFQALQTLTEALKTMASIELRPSSENSITKVDLRPVLDELRILIEPSFSEAGMSILWEIPEQLPAVWADRYGLLQVFLNITNNSLRAMQATGGDNRLTVRVAATGDQVMLHFLDTGPGVREPDRLFRPFQSNADMNGLGLYISRAILQTFRGELRYEPAATGSCFVAILSPVHAESRLVND
jgi:PAS domain S-box-containing protein